MASLKSRVLYVILVIITVVVFDQTTKSLIVKYLAEGEIVPIIDGWFNLTLTYNKGAAFGILSAIENDSLRLGILWSATFIAITAVGLMFKYEYGKDRLGQGGLALVLGGAMGNMIDRALLGRVVDFLDFYYKSYHWPAFNIADSAICVGVALLVIHGGSSQKVAKALN